jgi:hypothetical protein
VRSSLCALKYLSFMKQSLWYLLFLEIKPHRWLDVALELPRLWWAMEKFVNVHFTFARKEARANGVRKTIERDLTWSWLLIDNSSYLNRDVGIIWWWFWTSVNKSPCSFFDLPPCALTFWFTWVTSWLS